MRNTWSTAGPWRASGVVWSQRNTDFYGRDDAGVLVDLPYRGMTNALIRARIPYLPVHVDHVDREGGALSVLILPDLAALSDRSARASGGSSSAVGTSSPRGGRASTTSRDNPGRTMPWATCSASAGPWSVSPRSGRTSTVHEGPRIPTSGFPRGRGRKETARGPATSQPATGQRHPILAGFDETDILPFGGVLEGLAAVGGAEVLLTYVPPFPIYPPETAWMRTPRTDIPGLIVRTTPAGSRVAFLAADLDRRFGRDNLPDHGDLLANLVRWAAGDAIPLTVAGKGFIDCHLYRQPGRMILHLVNLTNAGTARAPVHELIPVGPLRVRVKLDADVPGRHARRLVAREEVRIERADGWASFEVPSLLDHEVVVIT